MRSSGKRGKQRDPELAKARAARLIDQMRRRRLEDEVATLRPEPWDLPVDPPSDVVQARIREREQNVEARDLQLKRMADRVRRGSEMGRLRVIAMGAFTAVVCMIAISIVAALVLSLVGGKLEDAWMLQFVHLLSGSHTGRAIVLRGAAYAI